MNIQQINQSGPSWWAVLVTAVILVFTALSSWGIAVRAANAASAFRQDNEYRALRFNIKYYTQRNNWFFDFIVHVRITLASTIQYLSYFLKIERPER